MESKNQMEKAILEMDKALTSSRTKLRKDVFIERHLPAIIKNNGKPTSEIQRELIILAGGETKVIDLVDDNDNDVISLPPAIGSNKVIDINSPLRDLGRALNNLPKNYNERSNPEEKASGIIKSNSENIIKELKSDPWKDVIEFFKDEAKAIPNKTVTKHKDEITFSYD